MKIGFTIPGKVQAKQSMRFRKDGHVFTDKDMAKYENMVRLMASQAMQKYGCEMSEAPMIAVYDIYFQIQKSVSKRERERRLMPFPLADIKPDTDNIAKVISDGCNGVVYRDDKQITDHRIRKFYSEKPYVYVMFESIDV